MDSIDLRGYIQNFSFDNCRHDNQGYSRVLIQLFGYTGHGKSSFINSCKYAVDDNDYNVYAKVANTESKPETMMRSSYPLTDNITLVDNRGCVKMNKNEAAEIYAQLGNFLPLDTEVKWHNEYNRMLTQLLTADSEDRSGDFITPVLVYSAKKLIASGETADLKEILTMATKITSISPSVIITHESSENLPKVMEEFRRMGVQLIFPLENYTEQNHLKIRKKHEKILKCLCEIIKDVEFRMGEIRNPRKEMTERKKILHTFLIEKEREREREAIMMAEYERMERERRKWERKRERERAREREREREAIMMAEYERRERERREWEREREREWERERERERARERCRERESWNCVVC